MTRARTAALAASVEVPAKVARTRVASKASDKENKPVEAPTRVTRARVASNASDAENKPVAPPIKEIKVKAKSAAPIRTTKSKPARKAPYTRSRKAKASEAEKEAPKPLSPKKSTQLAKATPAESDDELSGAKTPMRTLNKSPLKPSDINRVAPAKKVHFHQGDQLRDENNPPQALSKSPIKQAARTVLSPIKKPHLHQDDELSDENTSIRAISKSPIKHSEFARASPTKTPGLQRFISPPRTTIGTVMLSPARRPPPIPFKDTLRESPKRSEGFFIRPSSPNKATDTRPSTFKSSLLQSPPKRMFSPVKSNPVASTPIKEQLASLEEKDCISPLKTNPVAPSPETEEEGESTIFMRELLEQELENAPEDASWCFSSKEDLPPKLVETPVTNVQRPREVSRPSMGLRQSLMPRASFGGSPEKLAFFDDEMEVRDLAAGVERDEDAEVEKENHPDFDHVMTNADAEHITAESYEGLSMLNLEASGLEASLVEPCPVDPSRVHSPLVDPGLVDPRLDHSLFGSSPIPSESVHSSPDAHEQSQIRIPLNDIATPTPLSPVQPHVDALSMPFEIPHFNPLTIPHDSPLNNPLYAPVNNRLKRSRSLTPGESPARKKVCQGITTPSADKENEVLERFLASAASSPAKTPTRPVEVNGILSGAVVYVDVHTTEGADASGLFIELLTQMGAKCVKTWNWNPRQSAANEDAASPKIGITHVVYKDGGKRTLEKVQAAAGVVRCVGVSWVLDCEAKNQWLDESEYAVDLSVFPRGGARRRKSMEPRALLATPAKPLLPSSSLSAGEEDTPAPAAALMQQTCPPKQTLKGLFVKPVSEDTEEKKEKLEKRLEAVRRKTMNWRPRVSSPLGK